MGSDLVCLKYHLSEGMTNTADDAVPSVELNLISESTDDNKHRFGSKVDRKYLMAEFFRSKSNDDQIQLLPTPMEFTRRSSVSFQLSNIDNPKRENESPRRRYVKFLCKI